MGSTRPDMLICRHFCTLRAADVLLAMQKVEGSNPITRFRERMQCHAAGGELATAASNSAYASGDRW